jgi:VWFA-related protein
MTRIQAARAAACVGVLLLIARAIAAIAQQTPPTFRSGVDILNLDVSVLDNQRHPVRDLTAEDFTVLVEGKPRPIVAFSAVEVPARPVASHSASWLDAVPADISTNDVAPDGRALIIVFDHSIEFDHLDRARRAAVAAVEALGPNDLAAIAFTDGFTHVNTFQGFTADKALLLEVISRPIIFAPTLVDRGDFPGFLANSPSCFCNVCAFDKIGKVADDVANVSGRRKTVLFIGYETPDPFPNPVELQDPCAPHVIKAREIMMGHLARANLTVHVVDPSGAEPADTSIARRGMDTNRGITTPGFRRQQFLRVFSDLTRASFVYEDNYPERAVPAIMDETSAYYLVAIQVSPGEAEARASRMEVKVRSKNLIVQARTAYRATDTNAAVETSARALSLTDSISTALPRSDQRLTLTSLSFANPGQPTARVAVVMRAEPRKAASPAAPPEAPTARRDTINGVVVVFDSSGKIVASKKHTGTVPWTAGGTTPPPLELLTALDLAPGRYEIRAALETSSDARSSVYGFIDVPRFDTMPLSLSAIALSLQPAPVAAPKNAFADFLPIVPSAQRPFTKGDSVTAFVRVYRRTNAAAALAVRLVDADDRVMFEDRTDRVDEDYDTRLPLDQLSPGEYLLTFTATAGTDRATQQLRFTVD